MTIPYRGKTFAGSTYLVTGNTFFKKSLFHVDRNALPFIDVLFHYRDERSIWFMSLLLCQTTFIP
jgi:hypothetical protein